MWGRNQYIRYLCFKKCINGRVGTQTAPTIVLQRTPERRPLQRRFQARLSASVELETFFNARVKPPWLKRYEVRLARGPFTFASWLT